VAMTKRIDTVAESVSILRVLVDRAVGGVWPVPSAAGSVSL